MPSRTRKKTSKAQSKKPASELAREYEVVVQWSDEDRAFLATLPDWGNTRTHGNNEAEAMKNAREVLEMLIESAIEEGEPLPQPVPKGSGTLSLRLSTTLHGRAARLATRQGVSLNTWLTAVIAEALGEAGA